MGTYETSVYTTAIIIAILLGASIVYFVVSIYRQQRYYLEQQRRYFAADITLLERDRSRTAHDLHDEIGPLISAMRTRLQLIKPVDEKDARHIEKIDEYTGLFLKRMRQIAINLSPSSLADKGLKFAIQQMIENVQELYTIKVKLIYDVESAIDVNSSIHFYRIVREIAHNTIKHAKANELHIHFKERKGNLYVVCSDNGTGFVVEKNCRKDTGIGLSSLQSRTSVLKGSMRIKSKLGQGTMHLFEFPFPKSLS